MKLTVLILLLCALLLPAAPSQAAVVCDIGSNPAAIDSEEAKFFGLLNEYRASKGLAPVAMSPTLNKAAAWFAADMAKYNYLSHETRQGDDLDVRLIACGYTRAIYTWRAEIALGASPTAEHALLVWQLSPGHNAIMLDDKYTAVGIARAWNPIDVNWWWVVDFTSYLDAPLVTGPTPTPTVTRTPTITATPAPTSTPAPTRSVTPSRAVVEPVGGAERLSNGDFAEGLAGWEHPAWYAGVIRAEDGMLRIGGRSQGPYVQQNVPARGGETVTVSGSVQVAQAGRGQNGAVELVAMNARNGTLATYVLQRIDGVSEWGSFTRTQTLPRDTAVVRMRVRFGQLDGLVFVDELSVR